MAIPANERERIAAQLTAFCERVPARVRDQLRHGFTMDTRAVELFEERPSWTDSRRWVRERVARFRYVARHDHWTLFCVHRDLKWHRYELLPEARSFTRLLAEVDRDPTGIFWG